MSTKNTNQGDHNTGNRNHGDHNTGDGNQGNNNTGNNNTGDHNHGNNNLGSCNFGNHNIGSYNCTNNAWGSFNTIDCDRELFYMFDKEANRSRNFWIEDIKVDWNTMSDEDKLYCLTLENFDAAIFEQCTGVKLTNEDYMVLL